MHLFSTTSAAQVLEFGKSTPGMSAVLEELSTLKESSARQNGPQHKVKRRQSAVVH
jgi:hypothetical protein